MQAAKHSMLWFFAFVAICICAWVLSQSPWENLETNNQPEEDILIVLGQSMAPSLVAGDKVRLDTTDNTALQRGELVAVDFSTRERKMLKRIIALPGDRVEFIDGRLQLNDEWLSTAWWPDDKRVRARHYKTLAIQLRNYKHIVPKGSLIVMGDNSDVSYDSGDYGLIAMSQIGGRIITTGQ